MLMVFNQRTEETTDIPTTVVNVEEDASGMYTAYFKEVDGKVYYFTFTEEERSLFLDPALV